MEEREFWSLVESARRDAGDNTDARVDALKNQLAPLDLDAIQEFQHHYDRMIHRANRWNLWGAAYLMNGGCSDDCFRYFCHWLISEGRETFERALADPDSLAELPRRDYFELESFAYVALEVYENKGGGELERDFTIELAATEGAMWSEEELPSLLPRLAEKYAG